VAIEDSSTVWIALLKGFNGDVVYVGSDESYADFRLGSFFWSYYKVPACAARLPERFPVARRSGYVVQLHVENGNIHNLVSECTKYEVTCWENSTVPTSRVGFDQSFMSFRSTSQTRWSRTGIGHDRDRADVGQADNGVSAASATQAGRPPGDEPQAATSTS